MRGRRGSGSISAIQISPASKRLKTKRRPGASTRPTTREALPSAPRAGMSATGSSVAAEKTRTPPGS